MNASWNEFAGDTLAETQSDTTHTIQPDYWPELVRLWHRPPNQTPSIFLV